MQLNVLSISKTFSVYREKKKLHDSTYVQIFLILNTTVLHNLHLVESVDMENCRYRETASIEVQQLHMDFLLCAGSSHPYSMLFKGQLIFTFLYLPLTSSSLLIDYEVLFTNNLWYHLIKYSSSLMPWQLLKIFYFQAILSFPRRPVESFKVFVSHHIKEKY